MALIKPLKLLPDGNFQQADVINDDLQSRSLTSNSVSLNTVNPSDGEKLIIKGTANDNSTKVIHIKNNIDNTVAFIEGDGDASFKDLSIGQISATGNISTQGNLDVTGVLDVDGATLLNGNVTLGSDNTDLVNFNSKVGTNIDLNNHKITNVIDPTDDHDVATKAYVDANAGGSGWSLEGNNLNGDEFIGSINAQDIVFKRGGIELLRISESPAGVGAITFCASGHLAVEEFHGYENVVLFGSKKTEDEEDLNPTAMIVIATGDNIHNDSGPILISSGGSPEEGKSGFVEIASGESVLGKSGDIYINTGGSTETPGGIYINSGEWLDGNNGNVYLNGKELFLFAGLTGNPADSTSELPLYENQASLAINDDRALFNKRVVAKAPTATGDEVPVLEVQNNSGSTVAWIDEDGDITVRNMHVQGTLLVEDTAASLEVTGELQVKGDTFIGDGPEDSIYFYAKSATDLDMNNFKIISLATPTASGEAANKFYVDDAITTALGTLGTLGLPLDGAYGGPNGNISGVEEHDRYEDAFDKVEVILGKLAPAKPANLSTKTLTIAGTYTAYESGTGTPTLRSNVIDDTTPLAQTPTGAANGFWDAEDGTLTAEVDSVADGVRVLSTSNDAGTYNSLRIITDYDFYAGQAGKELFWSALVAGVESDSALSLGAHTYRLLHSKTGNTPVLTFYVDDPQAVTVTGQAIVGSGTGRYISGVPSLNTGDTITATFTVNNAIRQHYNPTRIAAASSTLTNSVNQTLPAVAPASGSTYAGNIALAVQASRYGEQTTVACTGYNSKGTTGSANAVANIRIDTVSNEVRVKSGQGQYPTSGTGAAQYGDTFDSTVSLVSVGNEELQMLNGLYQFPTGNYTSNLPVAGPNYSSAAGGSYSNYRWVTFNLGAKTSVSSITITINGGVNMGSTTIISGLALYVKVDGAIPTNGWIDANAAYPGVGNPTNNGDAALVVGSSSVTSKVVTFGSTVRTGNVYVRVGIPLASTKRFTNITIA